MANGHTIKTYSATDIEKYHKGLLSPADMHAMEKAALEDPFLADAMEGYTAAGAHLQSDLDDLKHRLAQRTEEQTKIIPLGGAGRSTFPFMRAAVMIGVLAGAGTLAYLFMFKEKEEPIAQAKPESKNVVITTTDTGKINAAPKATVADTNFLTTDNASTLLNTEKKGSATFYYTDSTTAKEEKKGYDRSTRDATPATEELVVVNDELKALSKSTRWKAADQEQKKAEDAKKESSLGFTATQAPGNGAPVAANAAKAKALPPVPAYKAEENNFLKTNIFRGRVTDGMNLGVPFAKVTNTDDNVGTYTDARGYFNLTSPDSVLNVQVRSIGFENSATQLRNSVPNNQVVLQNDNRMNALVINNQRVNTYRRSDNNNVRLEEPVPADGWENYDTYLSNNLVMPEEYRNKPSSTAAAVEVSFEVDAKGEPVNIRVEKSLCDKCDKEAIRLVKEGPKWKRAARNGRTTVTIPFNQLF